MQRTTKAELQMLRELAWLVLPRLECHFCHKAIKDPQDAGAITFGHRRHPPISEAKFSIHHFNRDREDNYVGQPVISASTGLIWFNGNLRFAHKKCHVAHHANERRTNEPGSDTDPD